MTVLVMLGGRVGGDVDDNGSDGHLHLKISLVWNLKIVPT